MISIWGRRIFVEIATFQDGRQQVRMAQWIRRLPTEQEILGSSPSTDSLFIESNVMLRLRGSPYHLLCERHW